MEALQQFILSIADDALIIGHRNSELTGLGPILEEDIAFSSMAQDKIGHAQALYSILHEHFGMPDADTLAFKRKEKDFLCCHLVELPNEEYDLALVRHFLFDHAYFLRFSLLRESSFEPLSLLARKIYGELKYHVLHADTWMRKLGTATEESKARMQSALHELYPYTKGIFESAGNDTALIENNYFAGEAVLYEHWENTILDTVSKASLVLPTFDPGLHMGGRKGYHTEHLAALLNEMTEVYQLDPSAEW